MLFRSQKWAETLARAIGNPLYHFSHLELQNFFGYDGVLNGDTAEEVWNLANEKLKNPSMSARNLIMQSNVTDMCTTDDPIDSLEWHKQLAEDESFTCNVYPTYRPDKALNIEKPDFTDYLDKLGDVVGFKIDSLSDLKNALTNRMDYFVDVAGCRASDISLDYVMYNPATDDEIETIFQNRLKGQTPSHEDQLKFKTAFNLFVGKEYNKRNWAMQVHYGAQRDNNKNMFAKLGADTGFDAISGYSSSLELSQFLNALNAP